jgi:hypothetical protein
MPTCYQERVAQCLFLSDIDNQTAILLLTYKLLEHTCHCLGQAEDDILSCHVFFF